MVKVSEVIPRYATSKPLPKKATVASTNGTEYRVMGVEEHRCACCEGTGKSWVVRLKGEWKTFETTLNALGRGEYRRTR